jgi:hypothetical protein
VDGTPGGIACRWQVEPSRDDQAGRQGCGEAGAQPGGSASVRLVSAPTGWRTVTSTRPMEAEWVREVRVSAESTYPAVFVTVSIL